MAKSEGELLPGTFDMLILKTLSLGPMHGWGVSERIERLSGSHRRLAFIILQRSGQIRFWRNLRPVRLGVGDEFADGAV